MGSSKRTAGIVRFDLVSQVSGPLIVGFTHTRNLAVSPGSTMKSTIDRSKLKGAVTQPLTSVLNWKRSAMSGEFVEAEVNDDSVADK